MFAVWLFYFVVLLGILFFLTYKYSTRKFNYWSNRNVNYAKPAPFFGNLLPVLTMKTTLGKWLWDYYNEFNTDFFGIFVFDQPVLVLKSKKLIKNILVRDFAYFDDRSVATITTDKVMSNMMFFMKNPAWKPIRSKVRPVFTSGKLKLMFPLIVNESNSMTDYISGRAYLEAREVTAKFSTNVIARCAFAVDAQSFEREDAEFRNLARRMFSYGFDNALRQIGSWFMPNLIRMFGIWFFQPSIVYSLNKIFKEVMHSREASADLNGNDLLDILIQAKRKNKDEYFSDEAILGHAIQFFVGGFETTSTSASFALYELAVNPEVQEKLREEILETVKNNGFTYEMIGEIKYLDMVVSESLRKYPVIPFIDRLCKDNYQIEGTNVIIEKGTPVYIPMFGIHYDPEYFPDPHRFDPERFADKSKVNQDGIYYIPFGEGPRICIGERFGTMVVKIAIISLLSKFRLEKTAETPVPIVFEQKSLILQSKVGIPIKFVPL